MGKEGLSVLYQRFKANGVELSKPKSVESELTNHARGSDAKGNAAKLVLSPRARFIQTDRTSWTDRQRSPIRAKVVAEVEAAAKSKGREAVVHGRHEGEVDAILLAMAHGSILLCNDRPALRAARSFGLTVATFADLLSAAMRDNHIDSERVNEVLPHIEEVTFVGVHDATAISISTLRAIPGL